MSKTALATQLKSAIHTLSPSVLSISVHVKPNSKKTGITWEEEQLQIKLNSPPVDNKANKEVCKVLAEIVDVPKGQVSILRGGKSKDKEVQINGTTEESVIDKIIEALD